MYETSYGSGKYILQGRNNTTRALSRTRSRSRRCGSHPVAIRGWSSLLWTTIHLLLNILLVCLRGRSELASATWERQRTGGYEGFGLGGVRRVSLYLFHLDEAGCFGLRLAQRMEQVWREEVMSDRGLGKGEEDRGSVKARLEIEDHAERTEETGRWGGKEASEASVCDGISRTVCGRITSECLPYSRCSGWSNRLRGSRDAGSRPTEEQAAILRYAIS